MNNRKNIRLNNYDYSTEGAYFITICTEKHKSVFGKIVNEKMILNDLGNRIFQFWSQLPDHNSNIILDEFIIMPNHIHGIIVILRKINEGVLSNAPTNNPFSKISPLKGSLSIIIRNFKAAFTLWCRKNHFQNFKWQRNYFDRVIRDEKELNAVREYIFYNPNKWQWDKLNPNK